MSADGQAAQGQPSQSPRSPGPDWLGPAGARGEGGEGSEVREGHGGRRARERRFWRRNLRWVGVLLAVWFVVTFVVAWFARELRFDFFGWPFSFWVGAQGAPIVYVAMAALYAWLMNRDKDADEAIVSEPDLSASPVPPVLPEASRSSRADAARQ